MTAGQKNEIKSVFAAYTDRLSELFKETGDSLSIPKKIYLHADQKSEPLFMDLVEKAIKKSTKCPANIKLITPALQDLAMPSDEQTPQTTSDTALLASAQFFHKQNHCRSFEYL